MVRLLLVDAWDSFTHNLVHALIGGGAEVRVVSCDQVSAADLLAARPDGVVLGPGPGGPREAGCFLEAVSALASARVPTLGVCLGQQAIGAAFGGAVVRHRPVHGHATPIHHDGTGVFAGLPPAVPMTRYHSLVVERSTLPACLRPTAFSDDGALMGLCHREAPLHGVQFHPESVLSGTAGLALLRNFVLLARDLRRTDAA